MSKVFKNRIILIIVLLFAIFLRIYKLGIIPSGFHQDEAINAYLGKFVLINGKDVFGRTFPIFYIDKWGDYPPALPMYFAGLGSLIFSDTVFGARIFFAIISTLNCLSIYLLTIKLTKNRTIGLLSAFFLAINQWHINMTRSAAEGIIALFFYTVGLWLFCYKSKKMEILSFIMFAVAFLSYPSFRITVPATFAIISLLDFIYHKILSIKSIVFLIIFSLFTLYVSSTDWGRARLNQTTIVKKVIEDKEFYNQFIYDEKDPVIARIFHNRYVLITNEFLRQYFSYFSTMFLFIEGGRPEWYRYPNSGLFYITMLIFTAGLFLPFKKDKTKYNNNLIYFLLLLLLIAPFPSALTYEHAIHMHRSILMILPFIILSSLGAYRLFANSKLRMFKFLLTIALLIEFINFYHNYFAHVSSYKALHRSDGNQNIAVYLAENKNKFTTAEVYISGWFPLYYLYFSSNYDKQLIGKIQKGMRLDSIDNINFYGQDCPTDKDKLVKVKPNSIVVYHSTCRGIFQLTKDFKLEKEIKDITGLPIFLVYRKTQ
ncbi:MAG: hypothetical protein KatS3mg090_0460 [Patescibacteria group bacterium]|nr:MAG: hypothetical protein KatS3mg090_0460 [Patescibacteria group bacterium]